MELNILYIGFIEKDLVPDLASRMCFPGQTPHLTDLDFFVPTIFKLTLVGE